MNQAGDRCGPYYRRYLKDYVFVGLSDAYRKRLIDESTDLFGDPSAILEIPLREADVIHLTGSGGIPPAALGRNMLRVMGIDPAFPAAPAYLALCRKWFGEELPDQLVANARTAGDAGLPDEAALSCRAALALRPEHPEALLLLAKLCRERYLNAEDAEEVGAFKAEALELFERLTKSWPDLAEPWYHLGYGYLNLGLYRKAELTFRTFLTKSDLAEEREEIVGRLTELEQPVQIEDGMNQVLAGRYEAGLAILEPFLGSRFERWWPLSYYLGVAYSRLGFADEAIERFQWALRLNPRHVDSLTELADIAAAFGDRESERKYRRKVALILSPAVEEGGAGQVKTEKRKRPVRPSRRDKR